MKPAHLPDPSFCNNAVLRRATRQMGQLYDDVLAPCGLRGPQFGLMVQSRFMQEPTMREMAQALVMDLSALGHSLKPLVRDGLVELVADPRDRRAKRVTLTRLGGEKLDEAMRLWRVAQDRFEAAFGTERAAELRATLAFVASPEFSEAFLKAGPAS